MMTKPSLSVLAAGILLLQFSSLQLPLFPVALASTKIIYGTDDRKDLYQVSNPQFKTWADSTVALVYDTAFSFSLSRSIKLKGPGYQEQKNVCTSEPFSDQPAAAYCSGTLIAKNLVLTAGHCVVDETECAKTKMIFGYDVSEEGVYPFRTDKSQAYQCSRIVKREQLGDRDYAVLELDRDVEDHDPITLAKEANSRPAVGTPLLMIGHPAGLPTKFDAGGVVRAAATASSFVATTDSYHGNSGSGIFSQSTGELLGILTSGEGKDYAFDGKRHCFVSKHCAENECSGEVVTRVHFLASLIDAFGH